MRGSSGLRVLIVILSVGVVVVSCLYIDINSRLEEQGIELGRHMEDFEDLTAKYNRLAGLPELVNISIENPHTRFVTGVHIVSGYSIDYLYSGSEDARRLDFDFATVFYSPQDNLTLRMYLFIYPGMEVDIPLTLQKGNAYRNESGVFVEEQYNITVWQSPVIWSVNASKSGVYWVLLPSKGWYTLSMTGSIKRTSSGATKYRGRIGRWENGTWQVVEHVESYVDFKLLKDNKTTLFAVKENP